MNICISFVMEKVNLRNKWMEPLYETLRNEYLFELRILE